MLTPAMSSRNLLDDSGSATKVAGVTARWMVHSTFNRYVYYTLCILTAGICHVVCTSNPDWKRRIICRQCAPIAADSVLVTNEDGEMTVVDVKRSVVDGNPVISFELNCQRYWTSALEAWTIHPLPDIPNDFSNFIIRANMAITKPSRELLVAVYGTNTMELPKASFLDILLKTMVQPFYLFQYFAVVLWMFENYILYSCVIILITGGAIYLTTSESVFNLRRLHDLAGELTLSLSPPYLNNLYVTRHYIISYQYLVVLDLTALHPILHSPLLCLVPTNVDIFYLHFVL